MKIVHKNIPQASIDGMISAIENAVPRPFDPDLFVVYITESCVVLQYLNPEGTIFCSGGASITGYDESIDAEWFNSLGFEPAPPPRKIYG